MSRLLALVLICLFATCAACSGTETQVRVRGQMDAGVESVSRR